METEIRNLEEGFWIAGLAAETNYDPQELSAALGRLWQQFNVQNIVGQLPDRLGTQIYCVYTDYCDEPSIPGTIILGGRVEEAAEIPEHLSAVKIPSGNYSVVHAEGHLPFATRDAWDGIDEELEDRTYRTDFEIYDARSLAPGKAEVEICIGVDS